ncbi:MAG: signal recognition particle-docking protein FtsY [Mycoplasmatales bacterium]
MFKKILGKNKKENKDQTTTQTTKVVEEKVEDKKIVKEKTSFNPFSSLKEVINDAKIHYGIGISQSFSNFSTKINGLFVDREFFDEQFFEDFEEQLVELDIVPVLAVMLREKLEQRILNKRVDKESFKKEMQEVIVELSNINLNNELNLDKEALNVLLIIGVNGVGKTTSISKFMHKYKTAFNTEVVAADTFRAGAIEQLNLWAEREEVPITQTHQGHAPSAVIYKGIESAIANQRDLLICDTAGRLHNKDELMEELKKIHKVINKYPEMNTGLERDYKVKTILVLDSTAGKNTIEQARAFNEITAIDGFVITKMDAGGKAGMIINLGYEFNKPIYYLTKGENVEALAKFEYESYVNLLLGE